MKKRLSRGETN